VIKDEPAVRWTLALIFQRYGIETDVAETGREAIALLSREDYCCVLLDLNIPPPDGIELARFIHDNTPETPVVVVSGYPDLAARLKKADLGSVVRLVLSKPVDTAFLSRHVHGERFCIGESAQQKI
jgi:CheY-like chemotaxis protein